MARLLADADRNFVLQQGLDAPPGERCARLTSALMFQPRVIFGILLGGTLARSRLVFAGLAALLAWCALVPRWNPFDLAWNRTGGRRPDTRLGPAPAPRRFAQAMAATFATVIAVSLTVGLTAVAAAVQAVFLAAVAALAFGRFCLGSFTYHLLRGERGFAIATLPWGPGVSRGRRPSVRA